MLNQRIVINKTIATEFSDDEQRVKRSEQWIRPLGSEVNINLIDWFNNQPIWPKCYWQNRCGTEEVAALGQIVSVDDSKQALSLISDEQRIWGVRAFADGSLALAESGQDSATQPLSSFFFLPQIELSRVEKQWFLTLNVVVDAQSVKQRQALIATLESLRFDAIPLDGIKVEPEQMNHLPTKKEWCSLVGQALADIRLGKFKKVVLARRTRLTLPSTSFSAAWLLKESRQHNHHCFHFMIAIDATRSFIGSTPERLYYRHGDKIFTEALAGTIGRGSDEHEDEVLANWLLADSKNITENQYVVDDILQRLSPYCEKINIDSQASLIRLRKVQHLKREISAQLTSSAEQGALLDALQPTAAVAGLPRTAAMDFIQTHELFQRGWYAGSVGYISHQQAEFCVAIRSALLFEHQIDLFAGAGIVEGSQAEYEWAELDKKVSTLLSLISTKVPVTV